MARKVLFDSSNSIGVVVAKNNQMSDWMGDLDDLAKRSASPGFIPGFAEAGVDNNFMEPANWLERKLKKARESLFGPDDAGSSGASFGTVSFDKVLVADSAVIGSLTLKSLISPVDSNTIIRDSLDSRYAFPPYNQRSFGGPPHQLHVTIDSGYIRNLSGSYLRAGKWLYIDSDLNKFYDSGVDNISNWDTNFSANYGFGLIVDSANIVRLSGTWQKFPFPHPRRYVGDSGYTDSSSLYYDSAYIKKLTYTLDSTDSSLLSDSVWIDAIANTTDSVTIDDFTLDFESSYDSVNFGFQYDSTDVAVGVPSPYWGKNVIGTYNYHDKLNVDSPFQFVSLLEVYTDSIDLSFQPIRKIGGYLLSQYDSDDRI